MVKGPKMGRQGNWVETGALNSPPTSINWLFLHKCVVSVSFYLFFYLTKAYVALTLCLHLFILFIIFPEKE